MHLRILNPHLSLGQLLLILTAHQFRKLDTDLAIRPTIHQKRINAHRKKSRIEGQEHLIFHLDELDPLPCIRQCPDLFLRRLLIKI